MTGNDSMRSNAGDDHRDATPPETSDPARSSLHDDHAVFIPLGLQRRECRHRATLCLAHMTHASLLARQQASAFLDPDALQRMARMAAGTRQHSFLLGRYCATQAVSQHLGLPATHAVTIENGVFGQPLVSSPVGADARIAISHSANYGCALAFDQAQPMGIDLEPADRLEDSVLRPLVTAAEHRWLDAVRPGAHACTWLWTVKEALGKALCTGIALPMQLTEVIGIERDGVFLVARFRHLVQYKALSFLWHGALVSIVLPARTTLDMPFTGGLRAMDVNDTIAGPS